MTNEAPGTRTTPAKVCHDCQRPYGDEHGFSRLMVTDAVWKQISPTGDKGGYLCPSCMAMRCAAAGITTEAWWASGPFRPPWK